MGDNILKSEVTEHISNRQTAKILYLQQELVQANDQIKDLEYMLKLNKEALRLSIEETPSKTDQITLDMPSLEPKSKEFAIISYFLEENKRLTIKNEILSKGRNLAQSRALISRQVAEESENRLKEIEGEFEEKIYELKRIIQDKEYTIQELEKVKPTLSKDGVLIKYREIMNPTEQLMKLQQENGALLGRLNRVSKKGNELEEKNRELLQTNMVLKKELLKIKSTLINPVNFWKIRSYIVNDTEAHSDEEGVIFPHEIIPELLPPQKPLIESEKPIKTTISNPNKISSYQPNFPMKLENLENENKHLREITQKEFINSQLLLSELKTLRSIHETLLNTNETLIRSNRTLSEKTQRLTTALEFYRVYFYEYMDLLKNSRRNPRSLSEKNYPLNLKHKDLLKTHDFLPKEDNKEVNVSILEEEKEKPKSKNRLNQVREPEIEQEHENVNYRNFLLNLAKELYTNSDVRSFFSVNKDLLKKMDIHNFNFRLQEYKFIIKPKRTLSNPLCYISEGLVRSLEKPPLKLKKGRLNNNNTKIRKMLYKGMSPGQFREGKSQILPSIFNLDVSKIANENLELSFDAKGGEEGFFLS